MSPDTKGQSTIIYHVSKNVNDAVGTEIKRQVYNLVGIVVHHGGSVHSGHYVAFVKVTILCMTYIAQAV
jgi:uncharacterized UBP type Zn finger protein